MTPLNTNTGIMTVIILLYTCTVMKGHVIKRSTENNDLNVLVNGDLQQNRIDDVSNSAPNVNRDDTKWFIPIWISPLQTMFEYVTSDDRFKSILKAREMEVLKNDLKPDPSDDQNADIFGTFSGRNINEFIGDDKVLDDSDHAVNQGTNNVVEPNNEFGDLIEMSQVEPEGLSETIGSEDMLTVNIEPEGDIGMTNNIEGPGETFNVASGDDVVTDGIREYVGVNNIDELSETNKIAVGLDGFIDELESELANSDTDTITQTSGTSFDNSELPEFSSDLLGTDRELLSESNEIDSGVETTETEQSSFPNFEVDQGELTELSESDNQVDTRNDILENYDENSYIETENSQNSDKSDDTWKTLKERICDQDFGLFKSFVPPIGLGLARSTFLLSTQSLFLFEKLQRELCAETENENKVEITSDINSEGIDIPVPFSEGAGINLDMFEGASETPEILDAEANESQSIIDDFVDATDNGFDTIGVEDDSSRQEFDATEVLVDEANSEVNTETEAFEEDI